VDVAQRQRVSASRLTPSFLLVSSKMLNIEKAGILSLLSVK
jgi:hypothetical protein